MAKVTGILCQIITGNVDGACENIETNAVGRGVIVFS